MVAASGTLLTCLFLMSPLLIYGTETQHNVGGNAGWTVGIQWPLPSQTFKAGDVLVFKYPPGEHNVIKVDAEHFKVCRVPQNPKIYGTGNDFIKLNPGKNYFICGVQGHCGIAGMKIVVTAE